LKRFCILSSCTEPWGGSEELWFEAALELRREGHAVDVAKTRVDPQHARIRELVAHGCSVHDLARPGPPWVGKAARPPLWGRIAKAVQSSAAASRLLLRRPDLAIVSQGINFDGWHLAWLCARLRIPYVLVSQKATELWWPSDAVLPYVRQAHSLARPSVFVCEHNRRFTELQIGAPLPDVRVVQNPLLMRQDVPLPWPEPRNGEVRLACVGRMFVPEKGQDLLLRALARDRWRARDVRLSLYGEGINRAGVEEMARGLGLAHVSSHGHTPHVEQIWRDHHALVLPSRAEGSSLAVQEAMACGRVPIVTPVGGNTELVEDEVSGFVAAAPTADALDDALDRAWARRDEWEVIGIAAQARIASLRLDAEGSPLAALVRERLSLATPSRSDAETLEVRGYR
jgi:glycosyltransferase involved in cell wall biosynthesis